MVGAAPQQGDAVTAPGAVVHSQTLPPIGLSKFARIVDAHAQADCLTAFAALRDGADSYPETTIELGEGCNRFPPSPDLARHLSALLDRFIRDGTLSAYAGRRPAGTRGAMAELLGSHLNMHLDASDIFFTRGGTEAINLTIAHLEAINLTIAHLAETGHGLVLPLPNYYAFDQSAVRWGAPVTAYYRHDGALHHTGTTPTPRTCLVEVLPNGVTGARHVPPEQPRPDFALIDIPFQIGAEGPQPAAILRDRVHRLDLETAALILTASKDLSLPGLRAAIVVTRNRALLSHLGRDRFERMAMTGDPVGEIAMLLFVSLLTVADAPSEQTGKLVQIAQDCAHRANLPALPDEETYRRIRDHLTGMSERFRRNALALEDARSPLQPITGLEPATGYSAFAELRAPQEDLLPWVARCGRSGLHLNPTVVHGGTTTAWEALYPNGQLLQLNLSEEPAAIDRGLRFRRTAQQPHPRDPRPHPKTGDGRVRAGRTSGDPEDPRTGRAAAPGRRRPRPRRPVPCHAGDHDVSSVDVCRVRARTAHHLPPRRHRSDPLAWPRQIAGISVVISEAEAGGGFLRQPPVERPPR